MANMWTVGSHVATPLREEDRGFRLEYYGRPQIALDELPIDEWPKTIEDARKLCEVMNYAATRESNRVRRDIRSRLNINDIP
jgi:hypothetical protein